ncbi:anti-sigma factor family protein [Pontibacillus yanchengensis]|uniref:Putative zinc-finger domain-containing protein n=1 Tax=Pontibacillus yanchengensis Y32 TaxID=1385514 RepID=A0A0A2T964_9BACI|nr:zf-HC2 domain-containing protein [Pontibacillus yanchengensis]KGP72104.1 hypothetical protein N782_14125 [Pontibacillus yanchengensis Y32]
MNHVTEEVIQLYINGQLQEQEHLQLEAHFEHCDTCFDMYLEQMDAADTASPLSEKFTDDTIKTIIHQHPTFQPPSKTFSAQPSAKRNTFLHYVVAAGFTILLMMSGVFQYMTDSFNQDGIKKGPSFSGQLMEKTGALLDQLTFAEEGNENE